MTDPKKQKIEIVIVVVMMAVLGLSLWYSKMRSEKRAKEVKPAVSSFNLEEAKKLLSNIQTKGAMTDEEEEKEVADPTKKPDELTNKKRQTTPMETAANPSADQAQTAKLTLDGIIWVAENGKNMALISGKVAYEGEAVAGAKIEKISKNEVTLIRDGETIKLTR